MRIIKLQSVTCVSRSGSDLSYARGEAVIVCGMSDERHEAMQNMVWVMYNFIKSILIGLDA